LAISSADGIADLGAPTRQRAHQVAHRVELAQLHQPRDGVQLVGEFVGLRAQRVGDALVRRQLALHRGQLGAVTHGGDRTDALPARACRPPVECENPCARGDHCFTPTMLTVVRQQEPPHVRVDAEVVDVLADRVRSDAQQVLGAVVEQRDDTVGVYGHDTLADAVQQRFPMIGQTGDLGDLEAAGMAFDASRQQPRRQQTQRGAEPEVHQQSFACAAEQLPHRRIRLADRHHCEDPTVGRQDRHLPDERVRPVDVGIAGPCAALDGAAGAEVDVLPDPRRLRGRRDGSVRRDDLHQSCTRQCHCPFDVGSQHLPDEGVRLTVDDAVAHDRRRRQVLGDRDHPLAAHLAELVRRLRDGHRGDRHQHDRDHQELEHQELSGETARGPPTQRPQLPLLPKE
jgi:hypothetical protein